MSTAVVGGRWHGGRMARLFAVIAAATLALMAMVAGTAAADPGPTPAPPPAPGFGSGWVQCGDRLIPADPRVDMQNPLGGLIYREMLRQMCSGPTQGGTQ